jgi:hypothetical protein
VLERRFPAGIDPGQATLIAAELVHDDYAYVFEAHWDLWTPDASNANWVLEPAPVKFIVQGEEFDEGAYQQTGHIEVDFGPDSYFLQPETTLNDQTRAKIRENVAKLVEFSVNVEKNSGTSARLLWSESEESLAQKLIARLQKGQPCRQHAEWRARDVVQSQHRAEFHRRRFAAVFAADSNFDRRTRLAPRSVPILTS